VGEGGGGEPEHQAADQVPVDHLVRALVGVGQQAVVTRPDAGFLVAARVGGAAVFTGRGVEVHDLQGGAGGLREGGWVVDKAAQRPGAAFGALHEQRPASAFRVGQQVAVSSLSSSWKAASMPRSRAIAAVTAVSWLTAVARRVNRMLRGS